VSAAIAAASASGLSSAWVATGKLQAPPDPTDAFDPAECRDCAAVSELEVVKDRSPTHAARCCPAPSGRIGNPARR
jgi:hypothetical protein